MEKNIEVSAIASFVDEEFLDLDLGIFQGDSNSPKLGDGFIDIGYYDLSLGDNSFLGNILVFKNGFIKSTIFRNDFNGKDEFDPDYVQRITNDFRAILGEQFEPNVSESYTLDLVSKENDHERFNRAKKFLVDNNIDLVFSEDEKVDYDSFEHELDSEFKHKK